MTEPAFTNVIEGKSFFSMSLVYSYIKQVEVALQMNLTLKLAFDQLNNTDYYPIRNM